MVTYKLEDFSGKHKTRLRSNIIPFHPKELFVKEQMEKYFSEIFLHNHNEKRFMYHFMSQNSQKLIEMFSQCSISNTKLTQQQFERLAQLLIQFRQCYATSKFDAGKIKVELHLPLEATAVFKKQRATRIPLQLQDQVLNILTHFEIIAPINTDSLNMGNTFINPVIIVKKGESLKIVLDARQLNTMINETKCSWPMEPI